MCMRWKPKRAPPGTGNAGCCWAINVVAGYLYADVHDAGVSFGVVTEGDDETATPPRCASWPGLPGKCAKRAFLSSTTWTKVVRSIVPNGKGPVLLVDSADNIGGGGPGDCTDVMRAFLKHDVPWAGVVIADPEAVVALQSVPIGGRVTLPVGGKGWRLDQGPVTLEVELVSRSDGRFETEDPNSNQAVVLGRKINLGPSAVVRHRGLTILLTSMKMAPFDLAQWRSQGVEPTQLGA